MSAELIVECLALLGVLAGVVALCAVLPRSLDTLLAALTLPQAGDTTTLAARYYTRYYLARQPEYRAVLDGSAPSKAHVSAPSHSAAARRRRPHVRPHVRSGAHGRTCRRHDGYGDGGH